MKGSVSSHAFFTGDSILNSSMYFHVSEGLCPDVMDDVLEGVAQYDIKELLNYFINSHILTLYELNSVVDNFPYFYNDITDKPTQIFIVTLHSSDHSLKQKSVFVV